MLIPSDSIGISPDTLNLSVFIALVIGHRHEFRHKDLIVTWSDVAFPQPSFSVLHRKHCFSSLSPGIP